MVVAVGILIRRHPGVGQAGVVGKPVAHRRAVALDHAVVRAPHRVSGHPLVADVVELDDQVALQGPVVGRDGLTLRVLRLLLLDHLEVLDFGTRRSCVTGGCHDGEDGEGDQVLVLHVQLLLLGLGGVEPDHDGRLLGLEVAPGGVVEVGVGQLAVDLGELGLVRGDLALAGLAVLEALLEDLALDHGAGEDTEVAQAGDDDAGGDQEPEAPHPPPGAFLACFSHFLSHVGHSDLLYAAGLNFVEAAGKNPSLPTTSTI